jgi:hypothetical protein
VRSTKDLNIVLPYAEVEDTHLREHALPFLRILIIRLSVKIALRQGRRRVRSNPPEVGRLSEVEDVHLRQIGVFTLHYAFQVGYGDVLGWQRGVEEVEGAC